MDRKISRIKWNIGKLIEKRSLFSPEKIALIFDDLQYSYKDLNERSNRLANYFMEIGLKKGDTISVLLRDSPEILDSYFAAAKLGLIFAPLNFRLTAREIEYQLNNSESRFLLFHDIYTDIINSLRSAVSIEPDRYVYLASVFGDAPSCPQWAVNMNKIVEKASIKEPVPDKAVYLDDPLAIIYTSGTTGDPKGALVSHEQTFFKCFHNNFEFDLNSNDIFLSQLPLFHSGGLFVSATPVIAQGATLLMRNSFNAEKFVEDIEKYRATIIFGLTTMWRFAFQTGKFDTTDVSSVKLVMAGGESKSASLFELLDRTFPGIYVMTGYGQTENSNMMFLPKQYAHKRSQGCVGLSGYFADMWIEDGDGRELPKGEIGEIISTGPNMMMGYWNMPEKTAGTIINGNLHTGDLAYRDEDGCFYLVDRAKDMYRSGGENVYPAEIENLLSLHPKIFNVAVIGVPDEIWGESGMAIIIPHKGEIITKEEIDQFLKGNLAGYKFPKKIKLVKEFPLTSSGKVRKVVLKEKYGLAL